MGKGLRVGLQRKQQKNKQTKKNLTAQEEGDSKPTQPETSVMMHDGF